MLVTMDVFLCSRKCLLLLHVVLLVLLSTKCLVQSRAQNHTVSLQKEDHVEADDELSGDDAETAEIAEVVGETRATAPAEWESWGTREKAKWFEELDPDKKVQTLNDLASEQYKKIVDEDIPRLKQQAERAKLMTPNTDITGRLDQLDSKLDGLRELANEVKKGTYNKGTQSNYESGFKVVYVVEKGKPEVRVHQDLNGKVDSLVKRSTPMREQHAERSLAVATAVRDNFKKIYDNWGVPGKELEVAKDMSLMLSGVMAAIPSPYTKGLAVILDLVSTVLGIVAPSAEDKVKGYIDDAVKLITQRMSEQYEIEVKGDLERLKTYWDYVMVTRNNTMMTKDQWDTAMDAALILQVTDDIKGTTQCQAWLKLQLDNGESPGTTRKVLDMYGEMVDLIDQVYSRIIYIMPVDDRHDTDDIQRQYIKQQKKILKRAVNWFKDNVVEFTRSSVGALYHLYPPAQSDDKRLLNFMREVTYERTDGMVMGVPYFPDPPTGTYYLESAVAGWRGYYVSLDRGSTEKVYSDRRRRRRRERRESTEFLATSKLRAGTSKIFKKTFFWPSLPRIKEYAHKLGTTIIMKKSKSTKIKIGPHAHAYYGARNLTFEGLEGMISFLEKYRPNQFHRRRYGNPVRTYTKSSMPIVARQPSTFDLRRGIRVDSRFRVIPLKKEANMPGVPVIIGEASGLYFWCLDTSSWKIYMKPLDVDETIGAGAAQKKVVANAHIFYLIS